LSGGLFGRFFLGSGPVVFSVPLPGIFVRGRFTSGGFIFDGLSFSPPGDLLSGNFTSGNFVLGGLSGVFILGDLSLTEGLSLTEAPLRRPPSDLPLFCLGLSSANIGQLTKTAQPKTSNPTSFFITHPFLKETKVLGLE
jgi:hypothetical protein